MILTPVVTRWRELVRLAREIRWTMTFPVAHGWKIDGARNGDVFSLGLQRVAIVLNADCVLEVFGHFSR